MTAWQLKNNETGNWLAAMKNKR